MDTCPENCQYPGHLCVICRKHFEENDDVIQFFAGDVFVGISAHDACMDDWGISEQLEIKPGK